MDFRWASRTARFLSYPVFRKIQLSVLFFCSYAAGTMGLEHYLLQRDIQFPDGLQTLLGISLSMLMVFRNNSSYDRWWEGRKLWGQLVNSSRALAAQVWNLTQIGEAERREFLGEISAFCFRLRDHLRGPWPAPDNPPQRTAMRMSELLNRWNREERLSIGEYMTVERHISMFYDIMGACERIRGTPLPLSHRAIIPQIVVCYLLALPWGLSEGVMSVFVVGLVTYFLVSLEMIAEELEEPFGQEPDDLPLTRTSKVIEKSILRQMEAPPEEARQETLTTV